MEFLETEIPEVIRIVPRVHEDRRGFLFESWNARSFAAHGLDLDFVQDNHSRSLEGTVRGLHYQLRQAQGKLVRVVIGEIWDVAVDLRRSSPTFGRWTAAWLSEENRHMLWIPPGFAHGFYVSSPAAEVLYKATAFYAPADERTLLWNDPDLAIPWPIDPNRPPLLSKKDAIALPLRRSECFP